MDHKLCTSFECKWADWSNKKKTIMWRIAFVTQFNFFLCLRFLTTLFLDNRITWTFTGLVIGSRLSTSEARPPRNQDGTESSAVLYPSLTIPGCLTGFGLIPLFCFFADCDEDVSRNLRSPVALWKKQSSPANINNNQKKTWKLQRDYNSNRPEVVRSSSYVSP